ncbi:MULTISPECIES: hypothetical protein [Methylobacterium]|jgi:hypothetical protein|uniref:Uncharacterized protein n=1 Tax=Methylobacterium isbiliense TaxID=315478 RepID=A0ABQ4S608_9HYPH|nr:MULTISPECIES: hypothetical protein [Methylobacterium]MBY0298007.1 hypothetical protein [Methylobacterium sp.]MDN3622210.1 hypothetical protein [Methylobacterium isbiliense]GJD98501.1 hypothetical protein GMJLKIPL_0412 [Methylobacterium isbiliense]
MRTVPALALLLALAAPAAAETAAAPAMPRPFRHVTLLGTTKPDGAALDARGGTRPDLDRRSRALGRLIATAICRGC